MFQMNLSLISQLNIVFLVSLILFILSVLLRVWNNNILIHQTLSAFLEIVRILMMLISSVLGIFFVVSFLRLILA